MQLIPYLEVIHFLLALYFLKAIHHVQKMLVQFLLVLHYFFKCIHPLQALPLHSPEAIHLLQVQAFHHFLEQQEHSPLLPPCHPTVFPFPINCLPLHLHLCQDGEDIITPPSITPLSIPLFIPIGTRRACSSTATCPPMTSHRSIH